VRAWIASPEFGRRAQRLGEFVRYQTSLPPRLSELAILVTARFWTSQYEWYVHRKDALASGLAPEIIDAIALRAEPVFAATDERLVYAFARALQETHAIGDTLYADCVEALGERSVVELVGLLGYYTLVSMTLNAFAFTAPSDAASLAP